MVDVHKRIKELLDESGWSVYRLSETSGVTQSSISHMFKRGNLPNLATLSAICDAFGISMAQFFDDDEPQRLSENEKTMLGEFRALSPEQRELVVALVRNFRKAEK